MAGNFGVRPKPSGRLRMWLTSAPCGPHRKPRVPQVLLLHPAPLMNLAERARCADVVLKFAN
jgi:hypothetical protein